MVEEIKKTLIDLLKASVEVLENEVSTIRPKDSAGLPGGLILLKDSLPTVIVPDLHGRTAFLPDLLKSTIHGSTVIDLLQRDAVQIICVGDGMHGEGRVRERWRVAYQEYQQNFNDCPAMDEEMSENLSTMMKVMELKRDFPSNFHFLKGNHENIMDENGNGNHTFAKFAAESTMSKHYVELFFGQEVLSTFYRFEKNLPLLVRGEGKLISHSRPDKAYALQEIIDYRKNPQVVKGLTWTRNSTAQAGATVEMLENIIGTTSGEKYWFSGHTPITGKFQFFQSENLIHFHNPLQRNVIFLNPGETFKSEKNIFSVPEC